MMNDVLARPPRFARYLLEENEVKKHLNVDGEIWEALQENPSWCKPIYLMSNRKFLHLYYLLPEVNEWIKQHSKTFGLNNVQPIEY